MGDRNIGNHVLAAWRYHVVRCMKQPWLVPCIITDIAGSPERKYKLQSMGWRISMLDMINAHDGVVCCAVFI